MASDIQILSEKITLLAELAQQLRRENADLRLTATTLAAENAEMSQRMFEARQKVAALMERYPAQHESEEVAS